MVKEEFNYNNNIINALEKSISIDRLSAYLTKTLNNKQQALELYAWNTEISAELYAPLQGIEIALRNAIHRELSNKYGVNWYDNINIPFSNSTREIIKNTKNRINSNANHINPPDVIADISFGFWVSLLTNGKNGLYHSKLWIPALHKSFPNAKNKGRRHIQVTFNHLRKLRNRIAHHEPIFKRDLVADYNSMLEVISWICPDTASWVKHHNNFRQIMAEKPD